MEPQKESQKPEYIHPKEIIRAILLNLPSDLEPELRLTMMALYSQSRGYHEKGDLDGGYIKFSGSISYGQIAEACGRSYSAAKRYCATLNEMKMLTWTVGKHWIEFTVCIAAAKVEFQDEDVENKFFNSSPMTIWRPSSTEGDFGRPVSGGTVRYVGGKCPYCKWDQDKRTHWCIDCYEEARGEGDGEVAVNWAVGEELCPECGKEGMPCCRTEEHAVSAKLGRS